MPKGQQKDITELKKLVVTAGYKVVPAGSGHWKVLYGDASTKKGQVVIDENGPIILSSSSSEVRSRSMTISRLMGAGILKRDPWAPQKAKTNGDGEEEEVDDVEVARREREAEVNRTLDMERSQRTHRVRERIEPIIVRIGGWDKRGVLSEVGLVAHYFAERLEMPDAWIDATAASENADALRKGATLSQSVAPIWEALLSELESWPDTRVRWMQLVSEAKGLTEPTVGEGEFRRSGWKAPAAEPEVKQETNGEVDVPMVALRSMFEMGVGRPAHDPDRNVVIQLGVEIARLEMQAKKGGSE